MLSKRSLSPIYVKLLAENVIKMFAKNVECANKISRWQPLAAAELEGKRETTCLSTECSVDKMLALTSQPSFGLANL